VAAAVGSWFMAGVGESAVAASSALATAANKSYGGRWVSGIYRAIYNTRRAGGNLFAGTRQAATIHNNITKLFCQKISLNGRIAFERMHEKLSRNLSPAGRI